MSIRNDKPSGEWGGETAKTSHGLTTYGKLDWPVSDDRCHIQRCFALDNEVWTTGEKHTA